ncbi:MAG: nucleotide sugar dehydrogenase [Nitrospinota bacterium]
MAKNTEKNTKSDVVIIGGLGHVGLPLGIAFAEKGLKVCLYDTNTKNGELVENGIMPFIEYGADPILKKLVKKKDKLIVSSDIKCVSRAKHIIVAIGTPVDEYLNPNVRIFLEFFKDLKKHLTKDQTIIIRSTVYPRTCQQVFNILGGAKKGIQLAYCPERIAQGYAIQELNELPQLVAGLTPKAQSNAAKLFAKIAPKIIKVKMEEAELVKLFTNAWRYIQFSITNQFYMIANDFNMDFNRIRQVMSDGYGRAYNIPSAGFAAGPCLLKDTMQLAAFNNNNFFLGHAAMMVNEGLPNYIVESLRHKHDLTKKKIGILGMAFKADIDDTRDSLSYKLGKILRFHGAKVSYTDEFAKDPTFISKEELVKTCDIIIIGAPHSAYKKLKFPKRVELVDIWGIFKSQ